MYYLIIFVSLLASLIVIDTYYTLKVPFLKSLMQQIKPFKEWMGLFLLFYSLKDVIFILKNTIANFNYSLYTITEFYIGFYLSYGFFKRLFTSVKFESNKNKQKENVFKFNAFVGVLLLTLTLMRLYKMLKYTLLY